MRSLHADLTAAQKQASTSPYVPIVIENRVEGVRRHDFAVLDANANAMNKHDVAVAGDNSVTRVRMDAGTVKQQRVVPPAAWTSWNNLVAGMGAQLAACAKGARVMVVYNDAATTGIRFKESTDNGQNYGADTLITTDAFPVTDLAVAYKDAAGDCAVAWIANNNLKLIERVSGAWGAVQTWPHAAGSLTGVAMVHAGDFNMLLTGTEQATTKPTLWSIIWGDGALITANTWSSLWVQQQAESTISTAFQSPFLTFADTFRATFVEDPTYAGGTKRTYRTYLHPFATFADGPYTWRTPLPVFNVDAVGLALANTASAPSGWIYNTNPSIVARAARDIVTLDVTADLLAIDLQEDTRSARGYVDLDNAAGDLAGPPAPIAIGNAVNIEFGYYTASGDRSSRVLDLWIAGYEYRRDGGVSTLRLRLESGWDLLRRSHQRTQIVHTADHYRAILSRILSRAGLTMNTAGSSGRAGSITPVFTIHPQTSAYEAVRQLLPFIADRLFMREDADALFTEPGAGESADYTLGTDHPLYAVELRSETPPLAEVQTFAAGTFGYTTDYTVAELGLAPNAQVRDLTSTTGSQAQNTAVAHMRQRKLDERAGSMRCPPVCGLEPLDVVQFTDALVNASAVKRRVAGIRWRLDRRRALYEQEIALGAM